jgi:hypothetical protein
VKPLFLRLSDPHAWLPKSANEYSMLLDKHFIANLVLHQNSDSGCCQNLPCYQGLRFILWQSNNCANICGYAWGMDEQIDRGVWFQIPSPKGLLALRCQLRIQKNVRL